MPKRANEIKRYTWAGGQSSRRAKITKKRRLIGCCCILPKPWSTAPTLLGALSPRGGPTQHTPASRPNERRVSHLVQRPGHHHAVPSAAVEVSLADGEAPDVPRVPHQRGTKREFRDVALVGGNPAADLLRGHQINIQQQWALNKSQLNNASGPE